MKKNNILYTALSVVLFCLVSWQRIPAFAHTAEASSVFEIDSQKVADLALSNSLDIQIARFDTYIKRTELNKVRSLFDTFLNAGIEYASDEKAVASTFLGTKTSSNVYSLGIEKKLPSGTAISVEAKDERTHTDSSFATINPAHEATVELTLTQELGKNFFGIADRSEVKLTKLDIENAEYTTLSDIEDALYETLKSYWNLVLKEEALRIRRQMRTQADRLYKIYQDKFDMGMVEDVDMAEIRAHLKILDTGVLNAELEKETAKNDLLFLLNLDDPAVVLVPRDTLETEPHTVDLYEKVTGAIAFRRDYRKIENELKKHNIELAVKKNALWPEIDLEASYTKNGLDSKYREAWSESTNKDHDEIFLGLTIRLSLENNQARSELDAARLQKEQLLLSLKRIERTVLRDINNQVMTVNTLKNKVDLTGELVGFQATKLAEEHKRLGWGRSNADVMVRYEDDLLGAQLDYAMALYQYRIGILELARRQNILLNEYWTGEL
ncbi:MAG: TolC family protein [Candidatus Omnitrophica bacterium]|nr:TolC family protein [Candidatus Omnitrophota bacterium]